MISLPEITALSEDDSLALLNHLEDGYLYPGLTREEDRALMFLRLRHSGQTLFTARTRPKSKAVESYLKWLRGGKTKMPPRMA